MTVDPTAVSAVERSADERCAQAMELHVAGRTDLAEAIYREIIASVPSHAAANYGLGMALVQTSRIPDALAHLRRAVQADRNLVEYRLGLIEALLLIGRFAEANDAIVDTRGRGVTEPTVDELAHRLADLSQILAPMTPAIASPSPNVSPEDLMAALRRGEVDVALSIAQHLCRREPENSLGWKAVGVLHRFHGRLDLATKSMHICVRIAPDDIEALSHLGSFCCESESLAEAQRALTRAVDLAPDDAQVRYRFATLHFRRGEVQEAIAAVRHGISIDPVCSTNEAKSAQSSLLFHLCHDPSISSDELFEEHRRIGARFEAGIDLSTIRHENSRDPSRRLRVGFVSGDFRDHAVAKFVEPALRELSRLASLELTAYYNHTVEDETTSRLRGYFARWRRVDPQVTSDESLASQIRADQIDVLIDLSGHTGFNRLGTFALKPAPVQASWLGYPGTTGLRAMDYYLSDSHLLPRDRFENQFVERLAHLPVGITFSTPAECTPINALPALVTQSMTFASFHRAQKLNAPTLALWSRLLLALPESRLVLAGIDREHDRVDLVRRFERLGIAATRLTLYGRSGFADYMAIHRNVDLCLDSLPYSGGTTVNHALWMGVPTLTLGGRIAAGWQAVGLLSHLGLTNFISMSEDEFLDRGIYWSQHLAELADIRTGLRRRWLTSPLRDSRYFAVGFELAMRAMWTRWCSNGAAETFEIDDAQVRASRTWTAPSTGVN
ncbi:MAG: tetratricopeptide repeat protein [Gammaproteobacteria bacterium]|nr:tetratricopeptide repeat protein [Gammaproteobacteria bacterium]